MPWVTISSEQVAKSLGVNYGEQELKQQLIEHIIDARSELGLTQADLARKFGVSQSRIARIESRIGTNRVSFEVLFRILSALGHKCNVTVRKVGKKRSRG